MSFSRYAFKLTYDEAVLGEIDNNDELLDTLNDYKQNWFIGIENESLWHKAILQEKPNLFSIGFDSEKVKYDLLQYTVVKHEHKYKIGSPTSWS